MSSTRRGFVMMAASLVASIPLINSTAVAEASKKIAQVAPTIPVLEPPPSILDEPKRQSVKVPGLAGDFYIKSINMSTNLHESYYASDGLRKFFPGLRELEIVLVSSGPVTIGNTDLLFNDPVKLYLPGE